MNQVLTADEFVDAQREPNWADAREASWLAVDCGGTEDLSDASAWINRQPIPVIGVGAPDNKGCWDACVAGEKELAELAGAIEANPAASAVLIQVLRASVAMPIESALVMESLAYATLQGGGEHAAWLAAQPRRTPGAEVDMPVVLDREGTCLQVTLNIPQRRNALSAQMRDALTEAFKLVLQDDSIESIELRGAGPCFSSGGDLAEFAPRDDVANAHYIRGLRMPAQYLARCAQRCHVYLHGACIGAGIELPAFAGRVSAQLDTKFRLPEVAMGLIPGAGGCVSIPRRVGRQRTAWLAITGQEIGVEQALQWGLIDEVSQ